ncbi:MAG: LytR C-terminal domain-containing protein [Gemmatimonadaceae bacterium]
MKARHRVGLAVTAALLAAAGTIFFVNRQHGGAAASDVEEPGAGIRAPAGVRIRVEVLNASRTRGLARRATMLLRDRGFDVVETGSASQLRDSTLVLDRSGRLEWATLAAQVLGEGVTVEQRLDTSRYLDVTVLLGAAWRPPSQPFYP